MCWRWRNLIGISIIGIPISLRTPPLWCPREAKQTQGNYGGYGDRPRRSYWGIGLAALVLVAFLLVVAAWVIHPYYPAPGMYYVGWWFFFPFGFIFFVFVLFFIGRLLFWPWGWGGRRNYWYRHDEAYYIIRQRYARGEITKDQYDQMMRDLEQHS